MCLRTCRASVHWHWHARRTMRFSSVVPVHVLLLIVSALDRHEHVFAKPSIIPDALLERAHTRPAHHDFHAIDHIGDSENNFVDEAGNAKEVENVICRPIAACEPCPDDVLHEPYCQPFGNRRLVQCVPRDLPNTDDPRPPDYPPAEPDGPPPPPPNGHHPPPPRPPAPQPPPLHAPQKLTQTQSQAKPHTGWESCGRIVRKERADFFEFVLCNIIFAALALSGVLIRSERMRAVRARRLAARIGVGLRRASSGSWRVMGGALVGADRQEGETLMRH